MMSPQLPFKGCQLLCLKNSLDYHLDQSGFPYPGMTTKFPMCFLARNAFCVLSIVLIENFDALISPYH